MQTEIRKIILLAFLFFIVSCAKEIYTDEDAANAKREAQKAGLTVMIRDMNNPNADLSGFVISSNQCGDLVCDTTSTDGLADLMLVRGDAVLLVKKDGYPETIAIVSLLYTGMERNNSVVVIPVLSETDMTGIIHGKVSSNTIPDPLPDVLVSIEVNMDDLISSAFTGFNKDLSKYKPEAIAYSSANLMLPVKTDAAGFFSFKIPVTPTDLTYTLRVYETVIDKTNFYGSETIRTNGKTSSNIDIILNPSGK